MFYLSKHFSTGSPNMCLDIKYTYCFQFLSLELKAILFLSALFAGTSAIYHAPFPFQFLRKDAGFKQSWSSSRKESES